MFAAYLSLQYATVEQDDEKFMTPVNLIRDYLGMQKVEEYNETTLGLLAGCADQTKDGYVCGNNNKPAAPLYNGQGFLSRP